MADQTQDHGVQSPAPAAPARRRRRNAKAAAAAAGGAAPPPEEHLNRFVRVVAITERAGNALGTLAFMWATVVLLGGFSSSLSVRGFAFATTLVFLEAARMFSQNNRLEYQFFFRTRGAFRCPRLNTMVLTICLIEILVFITVKANVDDDPVILITVLFVALAIATLLLILGKLLSHVILILFCNPQCNAISIWSPLVAILLLAPSLFLETSIPTETLLIPRIIFAILLAAVFVVTVSRLRFQMITTIVNSFVGQKMLSMTPVILFLSMCAAVVILGYIYVLPVVFLCTLLPLALMVDSAGNFQIPAAITRVILALLYFLLNKNSDTKPLDSEKMNVLASQYIFYGMVLGQGALYIVACILELFSFIPRRILAHKSGFKCQWGMKCINLYYSYIYEQCIEGGVLPPKIMQLSSFAMDYTTSDSATNQLYGVQMLHSLLQRQPSKAILLSRLITSRKTMDILISMLGWTSPANAAMRLFAAKVIAELSKDLQVAAIPGSMQNISSLIFTDNQLKIQNPLLHTYDSQEERQNAVINIGDSQNTHRRQEPLLHSDNQPNSWLLRCWRRMSNCCLIETEETSTDQDLLPVLGMTILEKLVDCDSNNCVEVSRETDLIPRIIEYTDEAHQIILKGSSLKLLRRLSNTGGEIGIKLRQKMSEHPFILRNLAEILDDTEGSQELRKQAAEIVRNLAINGDTRQEIGRIPMIISRLIHVFLSLHAPPNTYSDQSLQITAGQALALLAMESVENCSVMLEYPGYSFIRELITMIQNDRCRYVAASLLQNMCQHARQKLSSSDLTELSHSLRVVVERIMDTEEAGELEILIGLSSQICRLTPESFTQALEQGPNEERFVGKLVNALHANMKPNSRCPGIRRVIIEHCISMMELNSRYANQFRDYGLMEVLSRVDKTPSKAEKYRLFLGNTGLIEHRTLISSLVARAKQLVPMH